MTDPRRRLDEPTHWLRDAIGKRLAYITPTVMAALAEAGTDAAVVVVMTPLTEPADDTQAEYEAWDRRCDRCGHVAPPAEPFATGESESTVHGPFGGTARVIIGYGLCQTCAVKERPTV